MTILLTRDSQTAALQTDSTHCPTCLSVLRSNGDCGPCGFVEANGVAAYVDAAARLETYARDPRYRAGARYCDLAVVRAWLGFAGHTLTTARALIAAAEVEDGGITVM
jgi:hypothetical protein